jgi:hypothetical protein
MPGKNHKPEGCGSGVPRVGPTAFGAPKRPWKKTLQNDFHKPTDNCKAY